MKDLYATSEYVEIITGMLFQEFGKRPVISQLHVVRMGDGNTVFYVITGEDYHFLVNIMGRKVQDDALLYWIENINNVGKIDRYFYDRDVFVVTFKRGEKYNNEAIAYFYVYGNKYPAIRFVPEEIYPNYIKMLEKTYKNHELALPAELTADKETTNSI